VCNHPPCTFPCPGNLNPSADSFAQDLGVRSDSEMLVVGRVGLHAVYTGFSTNAGGQGLLAAYMTRKFSVSPDHSCSPLSSTIIHYCGVQAEPALRLTAWAGWTPTSAQFGPGVYTWMRAGGIWIGDVTGGGSADNHGVDMSYGQLGVSFQASSYISNPSYSVYWRSRTYVGAAKLSCYDHFLAGARVSGVYTIDRGSGAFDVYCDLATSGGGWDLVCRMCAWCGCAFMCACRGWGVGGGVGGGGRGRLCAPFSTPHACPLIVPCCLCGWPLCPTCCCMPRRPPWSLAWAVAGAALGACICVARAPSTPCAPHTGAACIPCAVPPPRLRPLCVCR
jgi:hypothetical protein